MLVAKVEHWVKNGYFEQLETTIIEGVQEFNINGGTATIITEREVRTIKAVFRASVKDDRREP